MVTVKHFKEMAKNLQKSNFKLFLIIENQWKSVKQKIKIYFHNNFVHIQAKISERWDKKWGSLFD